MENISEEELDWLADKLYQYAKDDPEFKIVCIEKHNNYFMINFLFHSITYGCTCTYEQDKEQRTA